MNTEFKYITNDNVKAALVAADAIAPVNYRWDVAKELDTFEFIDDWTDKVVGFININPQRLIFTFGENEVALPENRRTRDIARVISVMKREYFGFTSFRCWWKSSREDNYEAIEAEVDIGPGNVVLFSEVFHTTSTDGDYTRVKIWNEIPEIINGILMRYENTESYDSGDSWKMFMSIFDDSLDLREWYNPEGWCCGSATPFFDVEYRHTRVDLSECSKVSAKAALEEMVVDAIRKGGTNLPDYVPGKVVRIRKTCLFGTIVERITLE